MAQPIDQRLAAAKAAEETARQLLAGQWAFARERLAPSTIKEEAVGTAKFYANDAKDKAVDTVKAYPVAFGAGFAATLAFLFRRPLVEKGPQVVGDVADAIGTSAVKLGDWAAETVDHVKTRLHHDTGKAHLMNDFDKMENQAASTADKLSSSARDAAEAAKDRIASAYGSAKETASDAIEAGREKASELYNSGAEKAGELYEAGKEQASKAANATKEQIDQKPLIAVAGALALGLIAGLAASAGSKRA